MASKVLERVPKDRLSVAGVSKGVGTVKKSVVSSPAVGFIEVYRGRQVVMALRTPAGIMDRSVTLLLATAGELVLISHHCCCVKPARSGG